MSPRAGVFAGGLLAAFLVVAFPAPALGSQLIARNTSSETLSVSRSGKALITYRAGGRLRRVLASGAVGAHPPSEARKQVAFRLDYSGGWRSSGRTTSSSSFANACRRYTGPALPWLVKACTMPNGTHWALQRWQRSRANFGVAPWKSGHGAWELRLSHWRGPIARLEVWLDWSYGGRWHHRGRPVHGFATSSNGEPLDGFGRVLYLDTYDSAYGPGWRRENAFVARRPDGTFCYSFVPHRAQSGESRPAGRGLRYRLAVSGPGVTPDVMWEGDALHDFRASEAADREHETRMNALQQQLVQGAKPCHS